MEVVKKAVKLPTTQFSILLHSKETEPEQMQAEEKPYREVMDKLQLQLNKIAAGEKIDILHNNQWTLSVEERKAWLLSQCIGKKYIFVTTDTELPDNFIVLRYQSVKARKPTKVLVELGIFSK